MWLFIIGWFTLVSIIMSLVNRGLIRKEHERLMTHDHILQYLEALHEYGTDSFQARLLRRVYADDRSFIRTADALDSLFEDAVCHDEVVPYEEWREEMDRLTGLAHGEFQEGHSMIKNDHQLAVTKRQVYADDRSFIRTAKTLDGLFALKSKMAVECKGCGSIGFDKSKLPDQCTFCDGTEGGNPPMETVEKPIQDDQEDQMDLKLSKEALQRNDTVPWTDPSERVNPYSPAEIADLSKRVKHDKE